ncbi:hypothetical protein VSQ48_08585 [Candidatus Ventrimonas sp. KK005]
MNECGQVLLGIAALSTHPVGWRGTVKAGPQPVHFSLDSFPRACYFSQSEATHLVTVSRALGLFVP